MRESVEAKGRPWLAVGPADQCWPWRGTINPVTGYGHAQIGRGNVTAHRLMYRMLVGPIPNGGQIDHLCRNRACVNPAHMEVVTNRENALRRPDVIAARKRARCPNGHELAPENIYVRPNGAVQCRACKRDSVRRSRRPRAHA